MGNRGRFSRLGAKLAGASVLGLALAFVIFHAVDALFLPWLLYDERFAPFWSARAEAAAAEYQEYVTEHGLTVQQAVERQGTQEPSAAAAVTIIVKGLSPGQDGQNGQAGEAGGAAYSWNASYAWSGEDDSMFFLTGEPLPSVELRLIQCADGVLYISGAANVLQVQNSVRITGLLLALAGFCAVVIPSIVRLVRRIGALSREAGVLMAGDLDHVIRVKGRDELSGLGEDIERLRRSVLARLEGERQAVGANSRLITSLSHDLRTPLTKLTGYLDILSYGKYRTREEHDEFLRLAAEKAAQLKSLTDQLFASAQVDASGTGLEEPPEEVDGGALLGQLLAEQCDDLQREGFDARPPVFHQAFRLYLRTENMVRIFDNLFSNLKKYADPAFPVEIRFQDGPEYVALSFQNHMLPSPDRADSHGLGVPTMKELTARSGGKLEASIENGIYTSVFTFRKSREAG